MPAEPSEPDADPGLGARIKAFLVGFWNWTILIGAIVGLIVCVRLTYVFTQHALASTDLVTTLWFAALAIAGLAGAVFLAWQCWRGIVYVRHQRRQR